MSDKKISELPVASSINSGDLSVLVSSGANYQFAFSTLLQFISSGLSVGANISFGSTLPQNTSGKNGDVFVNTSAGSFAQKNAGTWAVVYTLPSSGGSSTGGTILYASGVPGSGTGNNNDTYIDTATGIFYKKSAGAWAQVFSMQTGPAGPQGSAGTNGTNGTNGKTILHGSSNPSDLSTGTDGDFYINTSTFTFFGPKAGGVWPAGTSLAGADGQGVPTGGATGQVLTKIDGTDFHTEWSTPSGSGVSGLAENEILFGKSDGTMGQDSDLRFDAGTKSLYVGNPPKSISPSGNIHFFGDSIAEGTGATDSTHRFSSIVASFLGLTEVNYGLPGSTLEEQTPPAPSGASSMLSRISDIPTKTIDDRYIVFVYGINDTRFVSANYNPTNFQANYETIIDACITKGWSASEILISSTTYCDPASYTQPGDGGTASPSLARQQAFDVAAKAASIAKGTMYVELFNYISNRGGVYNVSGVHPNNYGHGLMSMAILEVLMPNVYANGQGIATSRVVEFLNLLLDTKYVLPDGAHILGVDSNGKVGIVNASNSGLKFTDPVIIGGLTQSDAVIPTGRTEGDIVLSVSNLLSAGFNHADGPVPDWYGAIQLLDSGASMNFKVTYANGHFRFFTQDGNTLALDINPHQQVIVAGANTADNTVGDIIVKNSASLNSSVGGFKAGFIPFGTSNFSYIFSNLTAGKLKVQMSLGSAGALNDVWQFNADGSLESVIPGQGIILQSPDGTPYKISVINGGTLSIVAV